MAAPRGGKGRAGQAGPGPPRSATRAWRAGSPPRAEAPSLPPPSLPPSVPPRRWRRPPPVSPQFHFPVPSAPRPNHAAAAGDSPERRRGPSYLARTGGEDGRAGSGARSGGTAGHGAAHTRPTTAAAGGKGRRAAGSARTTPRPAPPARFRRPPR